MAPARLHRSRDVSAKALGQLHKWAGLSGPPGAALTRLLLSVRGWRRPLLCPVAIGGITTGKDHWMGGLIAVMGMAGI